MEKVKETIAQVKYENVLVKRKLKIVNLKEPKETLTKQKDSCIKEMKKSVVLSKGLLLPSEVLEPERKRRKLEQEIRELKQSMTKKEQIIQGLSVLKDKMETVIVETVPVLQETKDKAQNVLEQSRDLKSENEYLKLWLEDNAPFNNYDETSNSYFT